MTLDCEPMIRHLYPQFKEAVKNLSQDDDWFVDEDQSSGNLVSVARSVNLHYLPQPSYYLDLGLAYNSRARKGGYHDFDSLPRHLKLKFPLISLSDYDAHETGRATTIFGVLPRFIIGSDEKLYTIQNYYFFNAEGQSVKVEEVSLAHFGDETLEETLRSFGADREEITTVLFSPAKKRRRSWSRWISLGGGDLEKLGFIACEIKNGHFKRSGRQDLELPTSA